jgi:peroxiredoxin
MPSLFHKTALFALCATLLACSSTTSSISAEENRRALNEVLQMQLPGVGRAGARLVNFKGKIVLVHFFASWCGPCALEVPSLVATYNSFKDSRFTVVGIAVDDDPFQAQSFVAQHKLPFPVLMDTTGELKEFFSVRELPTTIFLNRSGEPIRFKDPKTGSMTGVLKGPRQWDATKNVEMIAGLVEGM